MLDMFKEFFLDPAIKRYDDAKEKMEGYNWNTKDQERRSFDKFKLIEGEMINLKRIYSAFKELIDDHEEMTDMLTEIYGEWYQKISVEGKQPLEIMSRQYDIIQTMWARIYAAIEPLNLNLDPPKALKDGNDN